MRYVHVASAHHRDLPECVQLAAQGIGDPDRRVLAMLGARGSYVAATWQQPPTRKKKSGSQPDLEVRAGGLEPRRDDARRQRVAWPCNRLGELAGLFVRTRLWWSGPIG
jgi:hypothetical protein